MTEFKFKLNSNIVGAIIELIDNQWFDFIVVDIFVNSLIVGSFKIFHFANIDDDHFGKTTSIFKTFFKSFKTTGTIRMVIRTKLECTKDQIKARLIFF